MDLGNKKNRDSQWQSVRLIDAATLQRGFDLPSSARKPGQYPIISSAGITGYHEVAKVPGPGVITGRYGSIGDVYYTDNSYWPLNTTLFVRDFRGNFPKFVYYLLQTIDYSKFSDKTGVPGVNRNDLHRISVKIPPIGEQKEIVKTVEFWDNAINQASQLLSAKRLLKKALMQQLLTGKRRFKEFVHSSKMQPTQYGPIPQEWSYPKIGKIAEEVSERNPGSKVTTVLSCTKHKGLVDSLEYFGKQIYSEDTSVYKVVHKNQFAYATNHIEEGSIGILDFRDVGLVSPMYTVFKTKECIDVNFLYALLKTELYRHIFEVSTSASVDRRGSLRWNQFSLIHVPLPTIGEQRKIVACLQAAESEINVLELELDSLKLQKRGLMQKLLTGKVRVNVSPVKASKAESR